MRSGKVKGEIFMSLLLVGFVSVKVAFTSRSTRL